MEVGAVFGELSLIYGTKRTASCKCSEEAIVYSLSKIPFRRIQATIAMSSIEVSMDNFNKQMSTLSEEQESATWVAAEVKLTVLQRVQERRTPGDHVRSQPHAQGSTWPRHPTTSACASRVQLALTRGALSPADTRV